MQSDHEQLDRSSESWEPCAQGELGAMATRLVEAKHRASRKRMYKATVATTALFACVILVVGSLWGRVGFSHGGISCWECASHFAEYHDHLTEAKLMEDAEMAESMQAHLEGCWLCRRKFNSDYPGVFATTPQSLKRPQLIALLPQLSLQTGPSL